MADQLCVDSYIYIYYSCDDISLLSLCELVAVLYTYYYYACLFEILYFIIRKRGFLLGGRCNGTRNLIIWCYTLCVRGILIATIRRPMRRTGRIASCNVTVPKFINIYLVSCALTLV